MHPELQAAFEADDRERADYARWQYKQQQASMVKKDASAAPGVIYKIRDNALQQPQQQVTAEDAEASARWDAWCDRRITGYVNPLLKREMLAMQREVLDLADEVGTTTGQLERELNALRSEVAALKATKDGADG